jgi:hypothetical protein
VFREKSAASGRQSAAQRVVPSPLPPAFVVLNTAALGDLGEVAVLVFFDDRCNVVEIGVLE